MNRARLLHLLLAWIREDGSNDSEASLDWVKKPTDDAFEPPYITHLAWQIYRKGVAVEPKYLPPVPKVKSAGYAVRSSTIVEATAFLKNVLHRGPMTVERITEAAIANGFTFRTIKRAKEKMGIISVKSPGQGGKWIWK